MHFLKGLVLVVVAGVVSVALFLAVSSSLFPEVRVGGQDRIQLPETMRIEEEMRGMPGRMHAIENQTLPLVSTPPEGQAMSKLPNSVKIEAEEMRGMPGRTRAIENQTRPRPLDSAPQGGLSYREKVVGHPVPFPCPNRTECVRCAGEIARGFSATPNMTSSSCLDGQQPLKVVELSLCDSAISEAEARSACLVYIFGVARRDPFTEMMGSRHPNCSVFAFDPTVTESDFGPGGAKAMFGQNVHFFSWGLRGGEEEGGTKAWAHHRYGNVSGELFTLKEIQDKLGHAEARITFFRSDCEGCEWAWIGAALREDPQVFSRIDELWMEVHFATTLRFDERALALAPAFHEMLTSNFFMLSVTVNLGFRVDRRRMYPEIVATGGIDRRPCCREFHLVNRRLWK